MNFDSSQEKHIETSQSFIIYFTTTGTFWNSFSDKVLLHKEKLTKLEYANNENTVDNKKTLYINTA